MTDATAREQALTALNDEALAVAMADARYEVKRAIGRAKMLGDEQLVGWLEAARDDIDRAATPVKAIEAEERKYTEADMEGEYQMGYREGLEANETTGKPPRETDDERHDRIVASGVLGCDDTAHIERHSAPSTPAGDGLQKRVIRTEGCAGAYDAGWNAAVDEHARLAASQPRNEDGLDKERLARAINEHDRKTPWDHKCNAGPGPTNHCEEAIAAEYAAQSGEAAE